MKISILYKLGLLFFLLLFIMSCDDYRKKKQIRTWNERLEEHIKEKNDSLNNKMIKTDSIKFSCNSSKQTYNIYDAEGYINIKIKLDFKEINQLRDNLAIGNSDTCFIYYHMKVFKNHTMKYDSISYQCIGTKTLKESILIQFAQDLKLKIIDEGKNTVIGFEPYTCALQMTLEVGENERDTVNQIAIGYSKSGNFSALNKRNKTED